MSDDTMKVAMDASQFLSSMEKVLAALRAYNIGLEKSAQVSTKVDKDREVRTKIIETELSAGRKLVNVYKEVDGVLVSMTEKYKDTTKAVERKLAAEQKAIEAQRRFTKEAQAFGRTFALGNQTNFGTASVAEKQSYVQAVANAKQVMKDNQITSAQAQEIWRNLSTGGKAYTGELKAMQTALIAVSRKHDELGASAGKAVTAEMNGINRQIEATRRLAEAREQASQRAINAQNRRLQAEETASQREARRLAAMDQAERDRAQRGFNEARTQGLPGLRQQVATQQNVTPLQRQILAAGPTQDVSRLIRLAAVEQANLNARLAEGGRLSNDILLSWGSMARLAGVQLAHRAISALVNGLQEGIDRAVDLEKRLAEIQTISQQSQLATGTWFLGLKDISNRFGTDLVDTVGAAYQAISNQVAQGREIFGFMDEAAKFAVTTRSTLTESVDLISGVMKSYNMETERASQVAAVMFKTIEVGRVTASEMANTVGRLTIVGSQLGISIEEIGAAVSVLSNRGVKFSEAFTYIRNVMMALMRPNEDLKQFFNDIGIGSAEAALSAYGLGGVLQKLEDYTRGSTEATGELFHNVRQVAGIMGLTNKGLDDYGAALAQMKNASVDYAKAQQLVLENPGKRLEIMTTQVKNNFSEMGDTTLYWLDRMSGGFKTLATDIDSVIQTVAILAGGTALKLGYTQLAAGLAAVNAQRILLQAGATTLGAAFAELTVTTGGLILVVAGLGYGIKSLVDEFGRAQREADALHKINKDLIDSVDKMVSERRNKLVDSLKEGAQAYAASGLDLLAKTSIGISAAIDSVTERLKESADTTRVEFERVIKSIGSELSLLNSEIGKSKSLRDKLTDTIGNTERDRKGLGFAFEMKSDKTKDQMADVSKEIQRLKIEMEQLAKAGDDEAGMFDSMKNMDAALATQRQLVQKATKENEAATKRAAEIRKKMAEEDEKYKRASIESARSERREVGKANTDNEMVSKHRKKQADLLSDHKKKQAEYRAELKAIEKIVFDTKDIEAKQKTILEEREKILNRIRDAEMKHQLELEKKARAKQREKDEIELVSSEANKFDVDKVLKRADLKSGTDAKKEIVGKEIDDQIKRLERMKKEGASAEMMDARIKDLNDLRGDLINKFNNEETVAKITRETKAYKDAVDSASAAVGKYQKSLTELRLLIEDVKKALPDSMYDSYTTELLNDQINQYLDALSSGKLNEYTTPLLVKSLETRMGELDKDKVADRATYDNMERLVKLLNTGEADTSSLIAAFTNANTQFEELKKQNAPIEEPKRTALQQMDESAKTLKTSVDAATESFKTLLSLGADLSTIMAPAGPPPVERRAAGGMMMGRDNIPALLSAGEFVMNAASTRKFHSQLIGMNSFRPYAQGGSVTNVGDINVSMTSSGNASIDAVKIGRALQREIRRGTLSLGAR